MPPTFTLGHIIGPVAVATVLNVFAFAAAWRWHQVEEKTGSAPWQLAVAIPAYLLPIGALSYFAQQRIIETGWQLFAGAMVGEAMGAAVVYALLNAFLWTRGQPARDRIGPIAGSLFMLALMAAAVLS